MNEPALVNSNKQYSTVSETLCEDNIQHLQGKQSPPHEENHLTQHFSKTQVLLADPSYPKQTKKKYISKLQQARTF